MALLALPNNRLSVLLTKFCELLDNENFQSLRLTCRRVYQQTHADAAVRYHYKLFDLQIDLDHKSLCILLHLVKIPEFLKTIECILFWTPDVLPLRPSTRRVIREKEERDAYIDSSEAVHLLAECLRYLAVAPILDMLQLSSSTGHHLLLAALDLVQFPNPCVEVWIEPDMLLKRGYGEFGRSPSSFARYLSWISLDETTPSISCGRYSTHYDSMVDRLEADSEDEDDEKEEDEEDENEEAIETEQKRRIRKTIENKRAIEQGFHVRDYRLDQPQIASFFHGLSSVPRLYLDGCDEFPRLRFCNACSDVFVYSIMKVPFTHLTTLKIRDMYISGGRLQRFIKQQAHTLKTIEFNCTTLTDGSWKTVARVLKSISGLEELTFRFGVYQKAEARRVIPQPSAYGNTVDTVSFKTRTNVQRCLKAFIQFFSTSKYVREGPYQVQELRHRRTLPQYYKVDLFKLPSR